MYREVAKTSCTLQSQINAMKQQLKEMKGFKIFNICSFVSLLIFHSSHPNLIEILSFQIQKQMRKCKYFKRPCSDNKAKTKSYTSKLIRKKQPQAVPRSAEVYNTETEFVKQKERAAWAKDFLLYSTYLLGSCRSDFFQNCKLLLKNPLWGVVNIHHVYLNLKCMVDTCVLEINKL